MNNPATRQQWILEQLTERPTLSYVVCLDEYFRVFGKSKTTFDKDWNKAKKQRLVIQQEEKEMANKELSNIIKAGVQEKHLMMCEKLMDIIDKKCTIEEKCYDMTIGKVVVFYREPSAMEQIEAIKEYNRINGI